MRRLLIAISIALPLAAQADYYSDNCPRLWTQKVTLRTCTTADYTCWKAADAEAIQAAAQSVCSQLHSQATTIQNLTGRIATLEGTAVPPQSQAPAPTATPPAGTYTATQAVTLSGCAGGAIYYTLDGTTPTTSSTAYSSALTVNTSLTIKALCHQSGLLDSAVASFAYTIGGGTPSANLVPWSMGYYATGFPGCGYSGCPISGIYWAAYTHIVNFGGSGNSPMMTSVPGNSAEFVAAAHANGVKAILGTGSGSLTNYPTTNLSSWASNLVSIANAAGYDGIDVDWETGTNFSQTNNQNIVKALHDAAVAANITGFLVTVASSNDYATWWSPPMTNYYALVSDMSYRATINYDQNGYSLDKNKAKFVAANVPIAMTGAAFSMSAGDSAGGANADIVANDCAAKAAKVQGMGQGWITWGMQTSAESRACEQAIAPYVPSHGPWNNGNGGGGGTSSTTLALIGSGTAHTLDSALSQSASVSGVTTGDTVVVLAFADDANASQSSAPTGTLTSANLSGITQVNSVSSGNNLRGHAWTGTATGGGTISVTYNTGMSASSTIAKKVAVYDFQGVLGIGATTSSVVNNGTVLSTTVAPQATGSIVLVGAQDDKNVAYTANADTVFDFNTRAGATWFFGRSTATTTAAVSKTYGATTAATGNYAALIMGVEIKGSTGAGGGGGGTGGGVASSYTPTRWVDCSASVNGNGLAPSAASTTGGTGAWNTVASIPSSLAAGTVVALKAGTTCTSSGTKDINGQGTSGSPVVLSGSGIATGYGAGPNAIIDNQNSGGNTLRIPSTASYTIIDGVRIKNTKAGETTIGGLDKAASATVATIGGITLGTQNSTAGGHNTVQNCEIENTGYGMWVWNDNNTIGPSNYIHDLRMIVSTPSPPAEDYGAVGIQIYANSNRVTGNTFRRTRAVAYDFPFDGGVVELFNNGSVGGQTMNNNIIDHNWIEDTGGVVETTGPATNAWIMHNVVIDDYGDFLEFHDAASETGFRVENNSVKTQNALTPAAFGQFIWCSGAGNTPGLTVKNNVVSLPSSGWFTHKNCAGITHDHNVWYKQGTARDGTYDWTAGTGEVWANPGWVGGSDLHLSSAGSPAYNAGTTPYYSTDFDGTTIPQFTTPDIGAYEFH